MCYSTTKGTARKPMSFPGVVKPSPWPGLQSHPPMAGPLWPHHHHHGPQASPSGDISQKISATTHLKVRPQARGFSRARDADSPTPQLTPKVTPSPVSQSRSFLFEDSHPRPVPVSTEPPAQVSEPAPGTAGVDKVEDDSSAGLQQLSPTLTSEAAPKTKRIRRRRCGTCPGCMRKENCGNCCVCTNPNSTNSVCKLKRCDMLKGRVSFY